MGVRGPLTLGKHRTVCVVPAPQDAAIGASHVTAVPVPSFVDFLPNVQRGQPTPNVPGGWAGSAEAPPSVP